MAADRRLSRRQEREGLLPVGPGGRPRPGDHGGTSGRRPGTRRRRPKGWGTSAGRPAAPHRDGQHPAELPSLDRAGRGGLRLRLVRRPHAGRQARLEGLLWPRADARGVCDADVQADRAEGDRRKRELRLDGPGLRQRDEPGRAGGRIQIESAAVAVTKPHPSRDMQVIVVAILFAILGVILGVLSPVTIPITYARYTAVALLAALDSIFGAFKAYIAGTFEPRVFFSGLLTNMTLAAGLVYFGDKLGVDLSIAAIVAFGVRIFNNLGAIRRHYL